MANLRPNRPRPSSWTEATQSFSFVFPAERRDSSRARARFKEERWVEWHEDEQNSGCFITPQGSRGLSPGFQPGNWSLDISALNAVSRRDNKKVGRAQRIPEVFLIDMCARVSVFLFETLSLQSSTWCARLRESDRTLRDGSFGRRCPRHFVPGYDRTVPPGRVLAGILRPQS
jgi:hypothetical protein